MKALSRDTHPDIEQKQIDMLREMGETKRAALALSLSSSLFRLSRRAIREVNPGATEEEVAVLFVGLNYGHALAERFREHLEKHPRREQTMAGLEEIEEAIGPLVEVLESRGIHYYIGGSVATSTWGIPRSTADADMIIDLAMDDVEPLVKVLQEDYYIDANMIRDAIRRKASFNIIHSRHALKIDVFVAKAGEFDKMEASRVKEKTLSDKPGARAFNISSPEDIALRKLEWYRSGGEVSERQWDDVVKLLRLWGARMDGDYLAMWAWELGVSDLINRALEDAGLPALNDLEF